MAQNSVSRLTVRVEDVDSSINVESPPGSPARNLDVEMSGEPRYKPSVSVRHPSCTGDDAQGAQMCDTTEGQGITMADKKVAMMALVLLIFPLIFIEFVQPQEFMVVPLPTLTLANSPMQLAEWKQLQGNGLILNPKHTFPIFFSGKTVTCRPIDLLACANSTMAVSGCCRAVAEGESITDTVPTAVLMVVVLVAPIFAFCAYSFCVKTDGQKCCSRVFLAGLFGYVVNVFVTLIVTEFFKRLVGRARPDYYALQLLTLLNPTAYEEYVVDKNRSFPSGHSSLSMCTLLYISLLMLYGMKWRSFYDEFPLMYPSLLALSALPTLLAIWIGVSRITDYRHNVEDVLAGQLIGGSVAVAVFIQVVWRESQAQARPVLLPVPLPGRRSSGSVMSSP